MCITQVGQPDTVLTAAPSHAAPIVRKTRVELLLGPAPPIQPPDLTSSGISQDDFLLFMLS